MLVEININFTNANTNAIAVEIVVHFSLVCFWSVSLQCFPAHSVCVCGTGSGQQSVTGVTAAEDSNSYWSVRGTSDALCHRGTPVKCGQTIRLTHVNTGRNLHSHYFASPLSSNQVCDVRGGGFGVQSNPLGFLQRLGKRSRIILAPMCCKNEA